MRSTTRTALMRGNAFDQRRRSRERTGDLPETIGDAAARFADYEGLTSHSGFLIGTGGRNHAWGRSNEGETPLRLAAGNGLAEVEKALIEWGVEINSLDLFGHAPLHKAVHIPGIGHPSIKNDYLGRIDTIKLLANRVPTSTKKAWAARRPYI